MNLVKTDDYGVKGINYYWVRREMYDLSIEELNSVGVFDEYAYVDESIIDPLLSAQKSLEHLGYQLIVKDAYRSPELYQLVFQKRSKKFGEEQTKKILNTITMPHTKGTVVDVNLIDKNTGKELQLRDKGDGTNAFFVGYYKNSSNDQHKEFNRLQELLANTMLTNGFKFGTKNEFWHFEYVG